MTFYSEHAAMIGTPQNIDLKADGKGNQLAQDMDVDAVIGGGTAEELFWQALIKDPGLHKRVAATHKKWKDGNEGARFEMNDMISAVVSQAQAIVNQPNPVPAIMAIMARNPDDKPQEEEVLASALTMTCTMHLRSPNRGPVRGACRGWRKA